MSWQGSGVPTEDQQARRRAEGGAGTGYHQPIEQMEKLSIVIHEKDPPATSASLDEKLKLLDAALSDKEDESGSSKKKEEAPPAKIQRVPLILQENDKYSRYFEPRIVAVGPLHHGKAMLQPAETLKLRLAKGFINEHASSNKRREYERAILAKIQERIKEFKAYYDEDEIKSYKDEELAWMFFVDGCSALHYLDCVAIPDQDKCKAQLERFKIKNHYLAFVQQDLLLLENQLPYSVLELLIGLSSDPERLKGSIEKFITSNMMIYYATVLKEEQGKQQPQQEEKKPAHLLDLLRKRLLLKHPPTGRSFIWRLLQRCPKQPSGSKIPSFRNVLELKAAGITTRRLKVRTSCLTDVSFMRICCTGYLRLHPLVVDDSTAPKFLNLVAYEMCPDFTNDFDITSYVCFLDSLIDEPGDVKELRDAGILHNALGSDEEVAKLFNEISTDLVPNNFIYADVKQHIQIHCDSTWARWVAQFLYNHFSSPWTFLAFLGAIIGLALSFLQTWTSFTEDPCQKVCKKPHGA